jgi:hypothetical protein
MSGLAAFMNEYNDDEEKTFNRKILLIGAWDNDRTHFLAARAIIVTP